MRTRSLFTTLACGMVLAGAGAGTAFADSGQPTATPTTSAPATGPSASPSAAPTTAPVGVTSTAPSLGAIPTAAPTTDARVSSAPSQVGVVPSGAPNTGVPPVASDGHGEAAAVGGSLAVVLGGAGAFALRRRTQGRG